MILASASPRRRELLASAGIEFAVAVSDFKEYIDPALAPRDLAMTLARGKALSVAPAYPGSIVLGADTIVVLDGKVLGKPTGIEDAARMLRMLSGRVHEVITAFSVISPGYECTNAETAGVRFSPMTEDDIRWYVGTGEPLDKAGAYAIQGLGARFAELVSGSLDTVIGLPVGPVLTAIAHVGKSAR